MYYSLLLGTYVAASGIHSYIRYRNIMKNEQDGNNKLTYLPDDSYGIVFYGYSKSIDMPAYIGNQNLQVPIGGGEISESEEKVYSKVITRTSNDLHNYNIIAETIGNEKFINSSQRLKDVLEKYNIDESAFKMTLPMKTVEYAWIKGPGLLGSNISSSKGDLVFRYAMKKRYPLTFTVLGIGSIIAFFEFDEWQRNRKYRRYFLLRCHSWNSVLE
jgi:hypothetical protein